MLVEVGRKSLKIVKQLYHRKNAYRRVTSNIINYDETNVTNDPVCSKTIAMRAVNIQKEL